MKCADKVNPLLYRTPIVFLSFALMMSIAATISALAAMTLITGSQTDSQDQDKARAERITGNNFLVYPLDPVKDSIDHIHRDNIALPKISTLFNYTSPYLDFISRRVNPIIVLSGNSELSNLNQSYSVTSGFMVMSALTDTITHTATITSTLTKTVTRTPTSSPTRTKTATPAPTKSPTITFTPSKTPTFTPSKSPTWTMTRTRTPFPPPVSSTPTQSETPTITSSATLTPTNTQTPTRTLYPLPTLKYTVEPTDTSTPTSTPTPTSLTIPSITPNAFSRVVDTVFDVRNALRVRLVLLVFFLWAALATGVYFYIRQYH